MKLGKYKPTMRESYKSLDWDRPRRKCLRHDNKMPIVKRLRECLSQALTWPANSRGWNYPPLKGKYKPRNGAITW
jgi:hypothetical protein